MSANIYWQRVNPDQISLSSWAPSSFMQAMDRAGMPLPANLDKGHWERLNAMAAVHGDKEHNPFEELADALMNLPQGGEIRVWAEY